MNDRGQSDAELTDAHDHAAAGSIPEDWNIRSLADIASLERGKFSARPRNDPKFFGGAYPFIQTGDVSNSNGVIRSFSQSLNDKGLRVSRLFPAHTLFFTIAANIGDVAIAPFPTACPDSLVAMSPNRQTEQRWLFYALELRKKVFEGLATQNAQLNINLEKLRPYRLPVPPLPEQRAIAGALSDVDALIGALDRLIAKKRDLKQAAMQQLLTGQTRLPGFSGEWEEQRLGLRASFRTGPFGSALHKADYTLDGVPIVNPMHIVDGRIVPTSTMTVTEHAAVKLTDFRLKTSDVVIGRRGDMGRCAVVLEHQAGWLCGTGSMIVRSTRDLSPAFLQRVLSSPPIIASIEESSVGTTMVNLNQKVLAGLNIAFPPVDEQLAIAAALSHMDLELVALEQRRDKTRQLKQGMMQELLTGRIRLV